MMIPGRPELHACMYRYRTIGAIPKKQSLRTEERTTTRTHWKCANISLLLYLRSAGAFFGLRICAEGVGLMYQHRQSPSCII